MASNVIMDGRNNDRTDQDLNLSPLNLSLSSKRSESYSIYTNLLKWLFNVNSTQDFNKLFIFVEHMCLWARRQEPLEYLLKISASQIWKIHSHVSRDLSEGNSMILLCRKNSQIIPNPTQLHQVLQEAFCCRLVMSTVLDNSGFFDQALVGIWSCWHYVFKFSHYFSKYLSKK